MLRHKWFCLWASALALGMAAEARAVALIVEDGRANAEIVIAETPPRMGVLRSGRN